MEHNLIPFEGKRIRSIEHEGEMWFSITDIISALTDSNQPRTYWANMKRREPQLLSIRKQLKMPTSDGKSYLTDAANTEGVLRLIQSVASPKAEPFKIWLASLGKRELIEAADPELLTERQAELYRAKGYPEDWIIRRVESIEARKRLTEEWKQRGVKEGEEYSILTATIAKGTFGLTPSEHGKMKGLKKENLRDHMSPLELIFTALSEETTRILAEKEDAQGFEENHYTAEKGGKIVGGYRKDFEKRTGQKVATATNHLALGKTDEPSKLDIKNQELE